MLFSPDMLALVLAGKKTQTRRRVDSLDTGLRTTRDFIGEVRTGVHANDRRKWQVGNTYAVQPGRGKKSVGRIRITSIRRQTFADITQGDAKAEGFAGPAGFHAKIRELYGADFDMTAPCWALTFELVK